MLWFIDVNPITDPPALEALTRENYEEASRIWRKQIYRTTGDLKPITEKNYSACHNLAVLLTASTTIANIISGVALELDALEQGGVQAFLSDKLGMPIPNLKELQLIYLDQIIEDIGLRPRGGNAQLMNMLAQKDYTAKVDLMRKYAVSATGDLDKLIEDYTQRCQENKEKALDGAQQLLKKGKTILEQVELCFPKTDLKYRSTSDKLAKAVLSCGIQYFEAKSQDEDLDADSLLSLYRESRAIACSDFVEKDIDEQINKLQDWQEEAPTRRAESKVKEQVFRIKARILAMAMVEADTIPNIKAYLNDCETELEVIKSSLSPSRDVYNKYSTQVAQVCLNSLVAAVNEAQEEAKQGGESGDLLSRLSAISTLKKQLKDAWDITERLEKLGLDSEFRNGRFSQNKKILKDLCSQLGVQTEPIKLTPSPPRPTPPPPRPTLVQSESKSSSSNGDSFWAKWVDEENMGCVFMFVIGLIVWLISKCS
ncbi:hypothetical protein [Porphyromonas sp. COT-290 OH3588]|uniref:hypothetical protein n=1 Tax=Porphyromonas sp. COT-290 OH3588 TaxID=1515617 RepID=UPI0013634A96|nr:hypothetical protein [Porphyromonas sp. COT-290 OH3588]